MDKSLKIVGYSEKSSTRTEIDENRDNIRRLSDQVNGIQNGATSSSYPPEKQNVSVDESVLYEIREVEIKQTITSPSESITTSCSHSLGLIKLLETILAAIILGCLWADCKFTWYASGYCYSHASAFQMQNFPVATCFIVLVISPIVLIAWFCTWEQSKPLDSENVSKRKTLAKVDTFLSIIFLLLNVASVFIEAWMTIKFNQEFSCPSCYKLALWSLATILFFVNSVVCVWNIMVCTQQRRFNESVRKKF